MARHSAKVGLDGQQKVPGRLDLICVCVLVLLSHPSYLVVEFAEGRLYIWQKLITKKKQTSIRTFCLQAKDYNLQTDARELQMKAC